MMPGDVTSQRRSLAIVAAPAPRIPGAEADGSGNRRRPGGPSPSTTSTTRSRGPSHSVTFASRGVPGRRERGTYAGTSAFRGGGLTGHGAPQLPQLTHRLDGMHTVGGLDRHHRDVLVLGQFQASPRRSV